MAKQIKGLFISDIHLPYHINLDGFLDYVKDFQPDVIILGGDIVDADCLHSSENMKAEQIDVAWYKRDVKLLSDFLVKLAKVAPKGAHLVFLEGNHEERYQRVQKKYPKVFKKADGQPMFDFARDVLNHSAFAGKFDWIPYGDYKSFWRIGDCLFTHGTIYPDQHAKKYGSYYQPDKIVYGHIHDYQAYTVHRGDPTKPATYGVTGGCMCGLTPEYKKGSPNKWANGFVSFISTNGITIPTVHLVEQGIFNVGPKVYGRIK